MATCLVEEVPMVSLSQSCRVLCMAIVAGAGFLPLATAQAQTADLAPYMDDAQIDEDLSRLDVQNVMPARHQLLNALRQLQQDQPTGNGQVILADRIAVIEARQTVIEAQILADQTRMPQAPADVQAMLQARDRVLRTEENLGETQKKLIRDQQAGDTGALREDVALVSAARAQSQRARRQWSQTRAQIQSELSPSSGQ
jgi:hypothetical protein